MEGSKVLKYGLNVDLIQKMILKIQECEKVDKIVLFGSRAKGNFREGSDIDLALFGEGIDTNDVLKMSISVDELLFPYKVDLIIFNRISAQELKDHIHRVGKELYKKAKDS